ncbi:MAG: DUF5106 domain-containing protein [Bacteroidales bacterium]|nr:DUF5106 domain-containing protein [Bacteroidales bacterium]
MRNSLLSAIPAIILLLSGCTGRSGIVHFWDKLDTSVTSENYSESEDRFAGFAELAADAPYQEAAAAIDRLFNKLSSDEVSYLVYSEWVVSAFHSILSPVRSPELFAKAVDRFVSDGIISGGELEPLQELAAKDRLNLTGSECTLPELTLEDGSPVHWSAGSETVFAVVNLDCATCVGALYALSGEAGEHVALCYGQTPAPVVPGWEYRYSPALDKVFDLDAAPFWFSVNADGLVQTPYSPIPHKEFATPDNI